MTHEEACSFLVAMPSTLLLLCDAALTWPSIPARTARRLPHGAPRTGLEIHSFPDTSHHLHMDGPPETTIILKLRPWLAMRRRAYLNREASKTPLPTSTTIIDYKQQGYSGTIPTEVSGVEYELWACVRSQR